LPRIIVEADEGRTLDQKRGLVRDITRAVVEHFDVSPDQVTVVIREQAPENVAKAGVLRVDRLATTG
jgi:4-oxalocrotonate tautomerase